MAYYNNNNEEKRDVNTRGFRTTNGKSDPASAFEWQYQGEMLKLIFTDELPKDKQTEKRRYDYDNSWITCVTRVKCLDLVRQMRERLFKAVEEKKDCFVSVTVAEVNQFGVGVRFNKDGVENFYAKLIRNISPETLVTTDEMSYEFKKGEVIVDYDNTTGKFGKREITNSEFLLFLNDMDAFVVATSKAFNHANRSVDKAYKDMISGDIRAIGKKVGAEVSQPYSATRAGASYGQTSLFDNGADSAPTSTINSLDELDAQLPFN